MPIFRSTPYTVISAQDLTGSYADTQAINVEGFSDMLIEITYITGAAETNNILDIQLKTSSGGRNSTTGIEVESDKYYVTTAADSSGTITLNTATWQYTGAVAATTYKYAFPVALADKYVTFSVKEEGVAANYGVVTIKVILVNKYQ